MNSSVSSDRGIALHGASGEAKHRENIQRVRDLIAGLPAERFDMRALWTERGLVATDYNKTPASLVKGCGTAACIAGWTLAVLKPRTKGLDAGDAAILLGLEDREADKLFTPPGYGHKGRYTHPMAVRTLDHLLATGKVEWAPPPENRAADGGHEPSTQGDSGTATK